MDADSRPEDMEQDFPVFSNLEECGEFDDERFGLYKTLTGIQCRAGGVVDAIQFVYDKSSKTRWHGGSGGYLSEFSLNADEHIIEYEYVTGMYGSYPMPVVAYIAFKTDKGRTFTVGNRSSCASTKNHTVKADPGTYFQSFYGTFDKYLIQFKSYWRSIGLLRFDDTFFAQTKSKITKVLLHTGCVIDGIQFVYDNDKPAPFHGGHGGGAETFELNEDEYITSISGKTGLYQFSDGETLCSLTISTNKGRSISRGTTQWCSQLRDFSYTAPPGDQILAFTGNYSGYMRDIEVGMFAPCHLASNDPVTHEVVQEQPALNALQGGTLKESVYGRYGYFSESELQTMLDATKKATKTPSTTYDALNTQTTKICESYVPKTYVNTKQIVFRAPTISEEQKYILENKKIISKAQRTPGTAIDTPVIAIDKQNGEQSDYSTILRTLAIKNSSKPKSQFVSHALVLETASSFAVGNVEFIFAYEIIPNSPFLGQDAEKSVKGELQYQIIGGTPIVGRLFRWPVKRKRWEEYNWTTKTWGPASIIPVNREFEELKRGQPSEL